jgi:hypothetical protein
VQSDKREETMTERKKRDEDDTDQIRYRKN